MSDEPFEPCDGLSAPILHRDADGHVKVEWEGRRGYLRQTLFSDNMVDEYARLFNKATDLAADILVLRTALQSLYDATDLWYDTDGDADKVAAAIDAVEAAMKSAGVVLGGGNE